MVGAALCELGGLSEQLERLAEWLAAHQISSKMLLPPDYEKGELYVEDIWQNGGVGDPFIHPLDPVDIAQVEGRRDEAGRPVGRASVSLYCGTELWGVWRGGLREGRGGAAGEGLERRGVRQVLTSYLRSN